MSKNIFPGVSYTDWKILSLMFRYGLPLTAKRIAEATKAGTKVYAVLNDLQRRDWVRIVGNEKTKRRRERAFGLTQAGHLVSQAIHQAERVIFHVLTAQNLGDLAAVRTSSVRDVSDVRIRGPVQRARDR